MSENSKSNSLLSLVAGVVVGAAVGIAVGMLIAPEKGAETRNKVKRKLEDLEDDVLQKVNDIIDHLDKSKDDFFSDSNVVNEEDAKSSEA